MVKRNWTEIDGLIRNTCQTVSWYSRKVGRQLGGAFQNSEQIAYTTSRPVLSKEILKHSPEEQIMTLGRVEDIRAISQKSVLVEQLCVVVSLQQTL